MGECDMLTSTVIPNYQRNLALDITVPLWEASHTVVYRKAQIQPDITGFLKPFSGVTWLCVLATFAACVASLFLMLKMPCEREKRFSFMRMAMGSTILGGFLLSAFYKAFLLSMLVLPRVVEPFNSLEDLVTRKPMPYLLIPGSLIEAAAKEAEPNTTFGKLYRNVDGWEKDFLRMIEKVAYGKWAIVGAKEGLHAAREVIFAKTRTCPLTNKDRFLSSWYSLCFRKNSPYTAPFNQIAVRLKESGILDMLDKKYRPNEIKCSVAKDVLSLRPLGITDLFGVFLLYAGVQPLVRLEYVSLYPENCVVEFSIAKQDLGSRSTLHDFCLSNCTENDFLIIGLSDEILAGTDVLLYDRAATNLTIRVNYHKAQVVF
ncbi:uncharacterized protein LOC125178125 [Hyalella azteca]|uniref:Uncharacterized protein LOC125178125 n=1 Tax=Hyalella azteca TaxID=294128 RepID=A0A979FJH1_HYAAZ|nr:uncharacterized protein LOC125178125 [Hyalella azteca]